MKNISKLIILILTGAALPAYGEQRWTSASPQRTANSLTIACEGVGPDRSVALRLARDQCVSIASDEISGDFHVQSLSVETESSSGFHQEVSADRSVKGLFCQVENQEVTEKDDSFHAWVQCRFDLKKVQIVPKSENPDRKLMTVHSENRAVIVSSVPQCQDVVVRGKQLRIVPCNNNPMSLFINSSDVELIVRAKGFLPKHLILDDVLETLEVYLEKE